MTKMELCHSGRLTINLDHLAISNIHRNLAHMDVLRLSEKRLSQESETACGNFETIDSIVLKAIDDSIL